MCLGRFTCQEEEEVVISEKDLAGFKKAATKDSNNGAVSP